MSEPASFGALARQLAATALPHDPNRTSLRKGIRAALVVTVLFAVTLEVIGGQPLATFAAFSSFVLLGMTDFGGPMRSRMLAYLAGTFVCAGLVALGTVLSGSVWSSVAGMLVVAFVVEFIGILGGYYAIAAPALILAYVLPTTMPALASDVPVRVAGWLVGGLAATVAALLLLPRRDRAGLRDALAATCERAAELVAAEIAAGDPATVARLRQAAVEALSAARARFAATLYKPTGPTAPDQALSQIVEELSGLLAFVSGATERLSAVATADRALATAMVDALRSATIGLRGTAGAVALEQLREARERQWQGLETVARAEQAARGDDPTALIDRLAGSLRLRIQSWTALFIAAHVVIAGGGRLSPAVERECGSARLVGTAAGAGLIAVWRRLRAHLDLDSVWCRNSLRATFALGLAVLVAELVEVQHAFWVVLGSLSVLRSTAQGTTMTAAEALAGTVLGFIIGGLAMVAIGGDHEALWLALPLAAFVSAYAPTAIHFAAGQAGFTIFVIVLFNLIQPAGWQVGLVRISDIAIGCAVSLVVGFILWPRGAGGQLRTAAARYLRRSTAYFAATRNALLLADALPSAAEVDAARHAVATAASQADDAFRQFLAERSAKVLPINHWSSLLVAGGRLCLAGDAFARLAALGEIDSGCKPCRAFLGRDGDALDAAVIALATSLEGSGAPSPPADPDDDERRAALVDCVRERLAAAAPSDLDPAFAATAVSQWLVSLRRTVHRIAEPTTAIARQRWQFLWR
jgi:uncharacterized membrane protein YccC